MTIRTRLNLWYTGLLAVALVTFGIMLYSLLSSVLLSALDDRLETQARSIVNQIQRDNDPAEMLLSGDTQLPPIDVFGSQYYIQILNVSGQPVQLSENLEGYQLVVPPDIRDSISDGHATAYTIDMQGRRVRVYSLTIAFSGRAIGEVQVGGSLTALDESLSVIRSTMLLGSVTALLLASAGGLLLGRAAWRPIQGINATTRQITQAEDLSRRIPVVVPTDELGQLTATINDMLARLEALFQAQQRLVADVSHDLRTPLTTIRGNLELLRLGAIDDPSQRGAALRAIEDETNRMSRLITDLLLLAQADAGLKLKLQPVELDTLLLDVYRQALLVAHGDVSVRLGAEDQALVMGDPDRLRQLLLNLVDNGIKYTPPDGEVVLGLRKDGSGVVVEVCDTGIGIAAEDLPHVFERFYRADRSRGRPGGSGLGLSIARWIAEAHGGRLAAESRVGQGTVFRLWLPLVSSGPNPSPAAEHFSTGRGEKQELKS